MTSILTNNGAMVALQTLKSINEDLGTVQEQISTGKKVGNASDNAAVWAISKTMESDVSGFQKINEGLNVATSTVAVARDASEAVTELLTQMKTKITQASGDNIDEGSRGKLQDDITALTSQVKSVVGAAQLNGRNLVNGTTASPMMVLSSLDRATDGSVAASSISVDTANLSTEAATAVTGFQTAGGAVEAAAAGGATPLVINAAAFLSTTNTGGVADAGASGVGGALTRSELTGTAEGATGGLLAGDVVSLTLGDNSTDAKVEGVDYITVNYTVKAGDNANDVSAGIAASFDDKLDLSPALKLGATGVVDNTMFEVTVDMSTGSLSVNNTGTEAVDVKLTTTRNAGSLAGLETLDVSSKENAATSLAEIELMIQTSIDAAAKFGTAQNQLETQSKFVGKLTDNLKAGIGSMVDANMEEASAKLKALQTQQQLGVQSLSIANQAPGAIMSLFR